MAQIVAFLQSFNWSKSALVVTAILTFALNQDMHPQVVLTPTVNFILMCVIIGIATAQGRKP